MDIRKVALCRGSFECGHRHLPLTQQIGKRIIGGKDAVKGSWPWMVMLTINDIPTCGGSIISNRVIITAAHCVHGEDISKIKIITGKYHKYTTDDTETTYTITDIVMHGRFDNKTLKHDIALLQLSENIPYSDYVAPVCLPTETMSLQQPCYTIGWGYTRANGYDAKVLKEVIPPIMDKIKYECQRLLRKRLGGLWRIDFCAGTQEADACFGDSGGPYMCSNDERQWFLVGISTFGYDCGQPARPGVYVNVSTYMDWINYKLYHLNLNNK